MKQRYRHILSALLGGILLTACSNDELVNIPSKELLNVSEVLLIDSESESATIDVKANCHWKVTLENGWEDLAVGTKEGDGDGVIVIMTGKNGQRKMREAAIYVESNSGVVNRKVTLQQKEAGARLSLGLASSLIEAEGESRVISVSSNANWTLMSSDPNVFACDIYQGSMDGSVKLTVAENMKESEREATLTFITEKVNDADIPVTQTLTIIQKGKVVELLASPGSITTQAIGGNYPIEVRCNAEWTVRTGASWAQVQVDQSEGDGYVNVICEQNIETQSRQTTIYIQAGSKLATVFIEQQPGMLPSVGSTSAQADGKYGAIVSFSYQSNTSEISEYGVCYATHEHPTVNDPHRGINYDLQTAADVTVHLSGLLSGTTYYVRPYVVNATGISYGEETTITTAGLEPQEEDIGQPTWSRRK